MMVNDILQVSIRYVQDGKPYSTSKYSIRTRRLTVFYKSLFFKLILRTGILFYNLSFIIQQKVHVHELSKLRHTNKYVSTCYLDSE